jgi:hypothetical protein
MKIWFAVALAIIIAGLGKPVAVHAAPADKQVTAHAMFAKNKTVKFALRNDSGSSVELKVGDQVMSLDAGKTLALKLPIGTRILMNASTPSHQAGELLVEASNGLDKAILTIK